ncbi:MAG TPA: SPOR domain-containing protein, partial [Rhodocyclaceae bacterium]|nr:SPOR domain-containing protein [Rhodocyclaceae bacterium]
YPTEPLPPVAKPQARPDTTRELPKTPALAAPPPAKAATIAPPSAAPPAAIFAPPTPIAAPRLTMQGEGRFFALQMGVFSNMANAEDMRAKLELHGIPTTVETRIHVGPFKTRAEADAARVKLRELGLDGGLLITMRK